MFRIADGWENSGHYTENLDTGNRTGDLIQESPEIWYFCRVKTASPDTRLHTLARELVAQFHTQRPLRSGSLLITVFGDVLYPRGGAVWLSDLLALMERFQLSQRLVRTSLTRLAQDGWFAIEQVGRRSVYRLSEIGAARIRDASPRIYGDPRRDDWDGSWTLVMLADVPADARDDLRRQLGALGMRPATPNTFMAPEGNPHLKTALTALQELFPLVVLSGAAPDDQSREQFTKMVHGAWDIRHISKGYNDFIEQFQGLVSAPGFHGADIDALLTRIMLLHQYRRLILRDPGLPAAILTDHWSGLRAYQLVRSAYGPLLGPSERAVDDLLGTPWGALPPRTSSSPGVDSNPFNSI